MLASMLTPLGPFRYVTNMASVRCVKCLSFHTPFLDRFECTNHTRCIFAHFSRTQDIWHLDTRHALSLLLADSFVLCSDAIGQPLKIQHKRAYRCAYGHLSSAELLVCTGCSSVTLAAHWTWTGNAAIFGIGSDYRLIWAITGLNCACKCAA